jgi:hypothetical protein
MANARIVNTPNQAIPQYGTTHLQTTLTTVVDLTSKLTLDAGTTHVLVQVNGADMRVTFDKSTDATITKGFRYPDGSSIYWPREMWNSAKAVAESGTVTLEVQQLNYR